MARAVNPRSDVLALYHAGYSIEKIAQMLGIAKQTVHSHAHADGSYRDRPWAPAEVEILKNAYLDAGEFTVDLVRLSKVLGRKKSVICNHAKKLGLTDQSAKKRPEHSAKSAATTRLLYDFGMIEHPRGFKGRKHNDETKAIIGRKSLGNCYLRTPEQKANHSLIMHERMKDATTGNIYSRARRGRRDDLGGHFFRSAWEANIARWLNFEKRRWEYEPKTFWFEKIRRGVRSYTPDFYLPDEDLYLEVKGWMDPKSKTKLKRLAKYFPDVRIDLIDAERYRGIAQSYGTIIPTWEMSR